MVFKHKDRWLCHSIISFFFFLNFNDENLRLDYCYEQKAVIFSSYKWEWDSWECNRTNYSMEGGIKKKKKPLMDV